MRARWGHQGRFAAAATHRYKHHTDWSGLYATWNGGTRGWGNEWDDDWYDCGCDWW